MRTYTDLKAVAMAVIMAASIIIITPALLLAEVLLHVDFDNHPLGPYTAAMGRADFHYPGYTWQHGMDQGRGEIVPGRDGKGRALRMLYPAGTFGANDQAVQIRAALAKAVDTAWVSYWVMFEDGFDFVKGGKLPGLCGGRCITGGNDADGYNGWSARVMWRREGVAEQYVYYTANNGYGEDMLFNKVPPKKRFMPGKWHRVNSQIIMNTPGVADGTIRTWFDGELSLERTDLLIRHIDTLKINLFYISTFFGGSDATWAPGKDTYITFDDFLVVSDPKSSLYPQALYELSGTSWRITSRQIDICADLSASLGNDLSAHIWGYGHPAIHGQALRKAANQATLCWPYYNHGVEFLGLRVDGGGMSDEFQRSDIIILDKYGLYCDSAWQAMALRDTVRSGDTLRLRLAIVDPATRIMVGPTITDAPAGEFSFFGALRHENGKFTALSGSNNYVDATGTASPAIGGAGSYDVEFVCTFGNPGTYSVSVRNPDHGRYTWEGLGRRGYALSAGSYGTWASRDRAGAVFFEKPDNTSVDRSQGTTARAAATKRMPSVRQCGKALSFSIPAPSTQSSTSAQIEIYNAKGALVKRVQADGGTSVTVPVRSKGLYLYRIKAGNGNDVVRRSVVVR